MYTTSHFNTNLQNSEKYCQKLKQVLTELEDKRHDLLEL